MNAVSFIEKHYTTVWTVNIQK